MARGPRKKRSDFDGNPDLNPDPGFFEGILPLQTVVLTTAKPPQRGFGNSLKLRRIAGVTLSELNSALVD